jgi:ribonuclease HII
MSATAAALSDKEYEERKRFMDDLKKLVPSEHEELFKILVNGNNNYSKNTNGVHFDISLVSKESFEQMQKFMTFCQANRKEFEERDKLMEDSRLNIGNVTTVD